MKAQILLSSTVAIALISSPTLAASRNVTINELAIANGRLTVQVPAGDGVVVDLSEVGQIVRGASFGDPTKFVLSGIDGQLCYMQQDKCEATGASVIAFRQVKGIEIPTQSHSPDGSTTVTLITDGQLGRKVLHVRLIPAVKATYTAIVVRENPTPVLPVVVRKTSTRSRLVSHASTAFPLQQLPNKPVEFSTMAAQPERQPEVKPENLSIASLMTLSTMGFPSCPPSDDKKTEVKTPPAVAETQSPDEQSPEKPVEPTVRRSFLIGSVTTQRSDANALAIGLSMANPRNNRDIKIAPRSVQYKQVQNAIIALRKGKTRGEAAKVSGLELQFIDQLIYLGQEYAF